MEKKIGILLISAIVAILLVASGSALMGFWDSARIEDNEVTFGEVDINETVTVPFYVDGLVPGENKTGNMSFSVDADTEFNVSVDISAITDPENGENSGDLLAGDLKDTDIFGDAYDGYGEADNIAEVVFKVNGEIVYSGTGVTAGHLFDAGPYSPGESVEIETILTCPYNEIANVGQTDSFKWDFEILVYQPPPEE